MSSMTAVVRCQETGERYLVEFEDRGGVAVATEATKAEGGDGGADRSDSVTMSGGLGVSGSYGGCPYCGQRQFFKCFSCENLSCYDGHSNMAYCHTCDMETRIDGDIDEVEGRQDSGPGNDIAETGQQSTDIRKT
jgi:hypothetical protein